MSKQVGSGLLRAMIDAIHGSDEQIGGQRVTELRIGLNAADIEVLVVSTVGFGELFDGAGDGRIVVGGEIIDFATRTGDKFVTLTRGVQSTPISDRYPAGTIVYDLSQNTTALDVTRRGFLVNFAIGSDLDQVGRNLGLEKCVGVTDAIWREVIRQVAYLGKQPVGAITTALTALQGAGNFTFFERTVSEPNRFFVGITIPFATDLKGTFFINSGEPSVTAAGDVTVIYPITAVAFLGTQALGNLRVISGSQLVDGETFILDDGVNPAVTFEFDSNASVVEGATLRQVVFTVTDSEETVRDTIITAIAGAPTLDITASIADGQNVALVNDTIGAFNVAIIETVADSIFVATGMAGGAAVGTQGVLGVFDDTPATREGMRDGLTNYFTGGSFVGSVITLGTNPGDGVDVLVDYNAHPAHYLPPNETFVNDGDFPPYFADTLLAARCLVDQVRAAGVGVELIQSI